MKEPGNSSEEGGMLAHNTCWLTRVVVCMSVRRLFMVLLLFLFYLGCKKVALYQCIKQYSASPNSAEISLYEGDIVKLLSKDTSG